MKGLKCRVIFRHSHPPSSSKFHYITKDANTLHPPFVLNVAIIVSLILFQLPPNAPMSHR
jgi:hypothetical protein